MTRHILRGLGAALLLAGGLLAGGLPGVTRASAHVVLAERAAPADSYFKVVLRVPHGCDGAATTGLAVRIPKTVLTAKPMVKPGWRIATTQEKLDHPVEIEGHTLTSRVAEITWRDGALPDDRFDEFAFLVRLPAQPGRLAFPVVQTCGKTVVRWDQAASRGQPKPSHPAPILTLTPAAR
jgi:uncharacterized protein YcnI